MSDIPFMRASSISSLRSALEYFGRATVILCCYGMHELDGFLISSSTKLKKEPEGEYHQPTRIW
jgi:hypothetical protein